MTYVIKVNKIFLIDRVSLAIKNLWPREDAGKPIFIQQDNARCHVDPNDVDFCRASKECRFNIQFKLS